MRGVAVTWCSPRCGSPLVLPTPTTASQFAPNPDFPTATFPNPEEPGATDALLDTAARVDADFTSALDPDADRCAVSMRTGDGRRILTGDETGALLGDHLLRTLPTGSDTWPR